MCEQTHKKGKKCRSWNLCVAEYTGRGRGSREWWKHDIFGPRHFHYTVKSIKKNKNKINVGMKDEAFASLDI